MVNAKALIGQANVLMVTFDSLRYDVARAMSAAGRTPNLSSILPGGRWEERRTPGTFTFPAHQAFFAGFLPKTTSPVQPPRLWECRPPAGKPVHDSTYIFDAGNILDGFRAAGYYTVCIGGVTYFSRETELGSVFPDLFDSDYWKPEYCSPEPDSTRHQVDKAIEVIQDREGQPLFLFVNLSATHVPVHHYVPRATEDSWDGQAAALAYVDSQLPPLLAALRDTGPWLTLWFADHGEAFGEDGGFTGHGIAHPTVWTVPYAETIIP